MFQKINWRLKPVLTGWSCTLVVIAMFIAPSHAATLREAIEDAYQLQHKHSVGSHKVETDTWMVVVLEAFAELHKQSSSHAILTQNMIEFTGAYQGISSKQDPGTPEALETHRAIYLQSLEAMNEQKNRIQRQLYKARAKYAELTGKRPSQLQPVITPALYSTSLQGTRSQQATARFQNLLRTYRQTTLQAGRLESAFNAARTKLHRDPMEFSSFVSALHERQKTELRLAQLEAVLIQMHFTPKIQEATFLLALGLSEKLLTRKPNAELRIFAHQKHK
ncbi:hypothetical protein PsAD2_02567 [Pseudovibrio axinellae]|uniref:Uncharacterized protein n=1 Tax=Pseudovibrio axinellae TaxID=989403 RepID=A0A165YAY6_9HYPH|nr:hypothetical protein [Pseudovibrio axinellae]KZL18626.1 hypothetical protein PsAD2_02567 [Pseudovibrio axinellae]SER74061.1 hypothetical protein SAMN05421798_11921 [Pseudovibrio axinellae]